MNTIPILLIAFNRPKTLLKQLKRIDNLSKRTVRISIDGPKIDSKKSRDETIYIANTWQELTHHEVEMISHKRNLGIYEHLPVALNNMFSDFSQALILEDDIEFVPEFVNFVDQSIHLHENESVWSICGHNPQYVSNPYAANELTINFRPSRFHSIWGWATSRSVVTSFLNVYHEKLNFQEVEAVLEDTARHISCDPFLRQSFTGTWLRKLKGWEQRRTKSGWDTRWVYQAWQGQRLSLIPDSSLSRETLDQSEGQTHFHESTGVPWGNPSGRILNFEIEKLDRSLEISHLKTWGINRRYSWLYSIRLYKEIRRLTS